MLVSWIVFVYLLLEMRLLNRKKKRKRKGVLLCISPPVPSDAWEEHWPPLNAATGLTQPRGDQHSVDALDGLADAGHHGVDLVGQVVLEVQAQPGLLLELLQGVGPLAGAQRRAVLGGGHIGKVQEGVPYPMLTVLRGVD